MIYLDNAATTFPKPERVYDVMDKMNRQGAVNAGRGAYRLAKEATKLIDDTKKLIRQLIHVDITTEVVFSPSITVAMNQIVNGLRLKDRAVIYLSPYEHNAVARSVYNLSKKKSFVLKELPLNEFLEIDLEKTKYEFSKDKPDAVFCTHVSNVTGYILPIKEIFEAAKQYDAINILDTAQSLGLIEIIANSISADLIAFAGHKTLYGPLGIGGFVNVTGIPLDVFISGGTGSDSLNLEMPSKGEGRYEAASSNIVAIAGLNAALTCLDQHKCLEHEESLTTYLITKLSELDGVNLYLPKNLKQHVGIVSFSIDGFDSNDLGLILDHDFDIAVRTGYHCAPYIHKYLKDARFLGTVRIGISQFTSKNDLDTLVEGIKAVINE